MSRLGDSAQLPSDNAGDSLWQAERRWYVHFRQSHVGAHGSPAACGLARTADDRWLVDWRIAGREPMRLGTWDLYEDALRVQDYCVTRDTATKLALAELHERANYEPLEKLLADAVAFGQLPRRRVRLTIEVDVEMRGTDAEIQAYSLQHVRSGISVRAARITQFDGPRIEEPSK